MAGHHLGNASHRVGLGAARRVSVSNVSVIVGCRTSVSTLHYSHCIR
jgi:hypothetical protein